MINIMYAVDPIKRIVKPMSGHAVTEQDREASSLRFAFPDNIAGTGLDSTGTAVRVMYIRPDGGDPVAKTLTFYKHSGGYYLYDWDLQKSDLSKEGHLVFSLCILDISGGEVSEWHTTPCAVRVLPTIHTDDSDEGDDTITPTVKERVAVLESMIQRVASGAPIVVSSTSAMTDTNQIYVLSTNGKWYYHNGSSWVAGGTYGAVATDTTLTQSGAPADAKAVGDEITAIKADLNKFADSRNLFLGAKFTSEKYYYGVEQSASTLGYFIIPVVSGNTYTFGCSVRFLSSASEGIDNAGHPEGYQYTPDFTGDLYVTVYLNESDKYAMCLSEYDISEIGTVQNPRLAQGLLAQASGDSKTLAMSQAGTTQAVKEIAVMLDGEGQVTPENIEGVTVTGGNVLDDAERIYCTQPGYVGKDGYVTIASNGTAIVGESTPFCTFLIPVKQQSTYTANHSIRFMALLGSDATSGTAPVSYTDVIGTLMPNVTSFETGNAKFALVSWNYSTFPVAESAISRGTVARAEKTIDLPDWWFGGEPEPEAVKPKYLSTTGDMSDGEFLALMNYKQSLRKGERYVFSGNIATMSVIKFGFNPFNAIGADTVMRNEFTIDSEHITYKTVGSNASYTAQYAHGLTFANNLQFFFEYLDEGNAKITLISNGMAFTQTLSFVKQNISQVVVLSSGSTLTDCKLTWTPIDIDKSIWMFGDSYFAYSSARWAYYLQQYGYAKNALLDGFPGEGSVNARNSLMTLIQFGTPKYIVWCMGMNDRSDTDASTPSTEWRVRRDEMLNICNQNGITPIFGTIPNVPSILHTGKNAWIKASGYRYIDFAAAVGAESAGSTWFAGMLSSDNIHPTEQGARALFAQVLLDFPEIMVDNLT